MTAWITAYIGVGSNVGDREGNCRAAVGLLREAGQVAALSSFYETEPVGCREQPDFINAVAALRTGLSPARLLAFCNAIEDRLGRVRAERWGPRTVDLDILLYGDAVISEPGLVIPHPRMAERRFVLAPLAEIAPDAVHPQLRRTARELLEVLQDRHSVVKRDGEPGRP